VDRPTDAASEESAFDVDVIREYFPALGDGTAYFDGPGGSQTPIPVADAIRGALLRPLSNRGTTTIAARNAEEIVVQPPALVIPVRLPHLGHLGGGQALERRDRLVDIDRTRQVGRLTEHRRDLDGRHVDRPDQLVADCPGIETGAGIDPLHRRQFIAGAFPPFKGLRQCLIPLRKQPSQGGKQVLIQRVLLEKRIDLRISKLTRFRPIEE